MVIDFHTHFFPDALASGAIKGLEKSSDTRAVLNGTRANLLQSMTASGIAKSVVLPIAVKPQYTHTINTVAIENNRHPQLISFGSVHPYCESWEQELHYIKDAGLKGIKLHPDFQNVFLDDEKTVNVMSLAGKLGLLITIHGGFDVSFPQVHKSTPKRLLNILPELKHCKIICAHSGGYTYEDDVIEYLLDKPQVYIDTSYSLGKAPVEKLLTIYKGIDPTHIMFGTDSPWCDQSKEIKRVSDLPLSAKLKENIFYKNALALLAD